MPTPFHHARPTIGVVAGWQYYWTATPLSYLNPIYHGIRLAAQEAGCNLLLGCGLGPSAAAGDPLRPAWPLRSPDADFVPIGPWNTTGLIAVCPLHSTARSRDLQQIIASGVNPNLHFGGVLMTMFDSRTSLSQQVVNDVRAYLGQHSPGDLVFQTVIPRTVRLAETPSFGQTILEYDPHGKGAAAYRALAEEFLQRQLRQVATH